MPTKKPPFSPSTATKSSTTPPAGNNKPPTSAPSSTPKPDNRWQRSKRYGWDSR